MGAEQIVRDLLERSGMSKSALCVAAGVSRSSLDDYVKGERQPSVAQLERLGAAAGMRLDMVWLPVDGPSSVLRPMGIDDVDRVVEIQCAGSVITLASVFDQAVHPFPVERVAERWRAEILGDAVDCYALTGERGELAGYAAVAQQRLLHYGTAVETWGRGLASEALAILVAQIRAAGHDRASLRVFEGNGRARRFYEKHGWQPTGERGASGFAPHPVLLTYELDLAGSRPE